MNVVIVKASRFAEFLDSFNPKDVKPDVTVVSAEKEDTILDIHENKKNTIKKKPETKQTEDKPKKDSKSYKEALPKPQKVKTASTDKSEYKSSNGGCIKTIVFLAALCIFLFWYNDLWIFSPKEDIVINPTSEQNDKRANAKNTTKPSNKPTTITDNNSLGNHNVDGFHTYNGYFIDSEGKYPVEFSFNLQGTQFRDCIYKNVSFGGKIKMKGSFENNLIIFRGKDGNNDFIMELGVMGATGFNLKGIAKDGTKTLDVELYEK